MEKASTLPIICIIKYYGFMIIGQTRHVQPMIPLDIPTVTSVAIIVFTQTLLGRTYVQHVLVTIDCDCGSAEWIKLSFYVE